AALKGPAGCRKAGSSGGRILLQFQAPVLPPAFGLVLLRSRSRSSCFLPIPVKTTVSVLLKFYQWISVFKLYLNCSIYISMNLSYFLLVFLIVKGISNSRGLYPHITPRNNSRG